MTGLRSGLMAASPSRPVEPKGRITHGPDEDCREQALDLVAGEWDQPGRGGTAGVLVGRDDREEGVGEVTQRDYEVKRRTWCSSGRSSTSATADR